MDVSASEPPRRCSACDCHKPAEEFAWRRIAERQRDSYCRPCRAAYKQKHYARNIERYKTNAARYRDRLLDERYGFLSDFLSAHPCTDCGETDVTVLEFDHLRDKEFAIAAGIASKSWADLQREMEKCEVVCANCHRRRSATRHGYMRAVLLLQEESGG